MGVVSSKYSEAAEMGSEIDDASAASAQQKDSETHKSQKLGQINVKAGSKCASPTISADSKAYLKKYGSSSSLLSLPEDNVEIKDPFCNPEHPIVITFQDVTSAAFKIKGGIEFTPCRRSHLSEQTGMDIFLKKEFLQFTGSFKERGARYCLLQLNGDQKQKGVISASLGNHAQGLCYHGLKLNIPVTVVMPVTAPIMKVQKCRSYGANVIVQGNNMKEAKQIAMAMGQEQGLLYVNGYDHPHIMAGQGTIGLEIVEQVGDADAVIIPVGGGGLIAGIATAIKNLSPNTKIIVSTKIKLVTR